MKKAFYSIPELARMASVHPDTIRRMIARRDIQTVVVGNGKQRQKHLVPLSEIMGKLPALFKSSKCLELLGVRPKSGKNH